MTNTNTNTQHDQDHGRENAKAWAGSIVEMVAALECDYDRRVQLLDELAELDGDEAGRSAWNEANGDELAELMRDAGENTDADEAIERIRESVLSVEVRSGWANVGDALNAEEFRILLTTGGPALQIRGELDENGEPSRAWLEYQDWGTGWMQYFDIEQSTLLTFCGCFYFGE